jgi:HSP20 family protein
MNQIGIGELIHAQTQNKKGQKSQQDPGSSFANSQANASRKVLKATSPRTNSSSTKSKEGQLAVDIYQTEDEMLIVCPIAGAKKEDVKIAIQDDVLTIRGERIKDEKLDLKTPLVRELFWGKFSRSIVLPDHIDRKNIKARVHEHLLFISIPKTEDFKTRIIHINED